MEDHPPGDINERFAFGPFCLSPGERLLTRDGVPIEIGGRSLDLLTALVEAPGRVLSKRDLLDRVWSDVIVEDGSLRFHMAGLRKILGEGDGGSRYIATQVGVGYAFVAPVRRIAGSSADALPPLVPTPRAAESAAGQLPVRAQQMIGRERELHLFTEMLRETRLLTIVGAAGVGKTALAVEVGHALAPQFEGRVHFVDLAELQDAALVASAIAAALGVPVQADDAAAVVLGHLRSERLLLILDNCEHLIDAVAAMAERVASAAREVRVLATSREPLRVRGEHLHWLASLEYPDAPETLALEPLLANSAVALFVDRATAANNAFVVDLAAARLIAEMCGRLDGMALPIELAAVRAATHGLEATSAMLGERLSLGWRGRRTAIPRQQTLKATLDWSYQLLSEGEQRLLERLSVFLGPVTIEAVLDVVCDEQLDRDTAAASFDSLVAKSLIAPDHWGEPGFYRLLEITRAFAQDRHAARGLDEVAAIARRHALLFLERLERVWAAGGTYMGRAPRFSQHLNNMRSALTWAFGPEGDRAIGVPLAAATAPALLTLSQLTECRNWCARAIAELGDASDTATELELQAALGLSLTFTRGNTEAAEIALRRALDIATALGDRWNQLRLLGRLHIFHERVGDFATARNCAAAALDVADAIGEPEALAVAASLSGVSSHLAGDQTRARAELVRSLSQGLSYDRNRTIYYGFDHRNRSNIALSRVLWLQGFTDQARERATQTVRAAAGLDSPVTHCIALIWALSVFDWSGDVGLTREAFDTFAQTAEVNAFGPYIAATVGYRGLLALDAGQAGAAVGWIEESLARLRSARYELLTTTFVLGLTDGLAATGRGIEALELLDTTIKRCEASGELVAMPELLRMKARVVKGVPNADAAPEQLLRDACDLSRAQGALGWELRAAIDLAAFWIACDRHDEAAALLGPLRDRFSEGFDGADLRRADALLGTLAPTRSAESATPPTSAHAA